MSRGKAHALQQWMRPGILEGPCRADPPPDCLLRAMAGKPPSRSGRSVARIYWNAVLQGLQRAEEEAVHRWLSRAQSLTSAEDWDKSRSRSPSGRAERAVTLEAAVDPLPTGLKPAQKAHPKTKVKPQPLESLESAATLGPEGALPPGPSPPCPAAGAHLLVVSKSRQDAGMDVERAWTVDCQFLWVNMDEELEGHLGLHPATLAEVACRLGPVLPVVREAVEARGVAAAAPGCLQFECEDGRRASVAVACLVVSLLVGLGHPVQILHLELEYDTHKDSCPVCSGLVQEEAAEAVLRLWRDLPLD